MNDEKLNVNQINSSYVKIADIFTVNNEIYQEKILGSENVEKFIKLSAERKKEFLKWLKQDKVDSSYTNATRFFSLILIENELHNEKELAEYSKNEIEQMMLNLSQTRSEEFIKKPTIESYLTIIQWYTIWAYEKELRNDIITRRDLSFDAKDLVNKVVTKEIVLTRKEIDQYLQQINDEMVYITLKLSTYGLEVREIVNITKDNVYRAKETNILHLLNRNVKLDKSILDEMIDVCNQEMVEIGIGSKAGRVRKISKLLNMNSDYMIRTHHRKKSSNQPINVCNMGTRIKKEISKLTNVKLTFNDFRKSAMLNDYLHGMSCNQINTKYNLNFSDESILIALNKIELEILKQKIKEENRSCLIRS